MTQSGVLGLYCVHFGQLKSHPAIYTLLFSLQLCCKPLHIPQKVTESQKVHISSHDALQNFITPTFLNIGPVVSQIEHRIARISYFTH